MTTARPLKAFTYSRFRDRMLTRLASRLARFEPSSGPSVFPVVRPNRFRR